MGRITQGFRLLGASWHVLRADKELLVLPLVSFAAILAVAVPMALGIFGLGLTSPEGEPGFTSPLQFVFIGCFYFAASFISIFFNAAVVGAATIRLEGGDPTPRDGMRLAYERIDKILAWSFVSATVGMILRALEQRAGWLGRIAIALVGAAWGAVTFFVIPVMLYEPLGVGASIKRSASLFKQRWGEQFVGNGAIGMAVFVIMIPLMAMLFVLGNISAALAVMFGFLAFGTLITVTACLTGIFNAALYRYATTGDAPGTFTEQDLRGMFHERRRGLLS